MLLFLASWWLTYLCSIPILIMHLLRSLPLNSLQVNTFWSFICDLVNDLAAVLVQSSSCYSWSTDLNNLCIYNGIEICLFFLSFENLVSNKWHLVALSTHSILSYGISYLSLYCQCHSNSIEFSDVVSINIIE